jgi:hypothetical protein
MSELRVVVGLLGVVALTLAACGSAFDSGTPSSSTSTGVTGSGGATTSTAANGGSSAGGGVPTGTSAGGGSTVTTGGGGVGGGATTAHGGGGSTGGGGAGGASTTTSGSGGGATTTSGGCSPGERCVGAAPFGWTGPVAFERGPAVSCNEAGWATQIFAGGTHVDSPAQCSACGCAPTGGTCAKTTSIAHYDNLNCNSLKIDDSVSTTCGFGQFSAIVVSPSPVYDAKCVLVTPAQVTGNPIFDEHGVVCGGGQGDSCKDGVCAREATRLCIYKIGLIKCPDPYSEQHVVYANIDDNRGCTQCACGAASGVTCEPTVGVYGHAGCAGGVTQEIKPADGCTLIPDLISSMRIEDVGTRGGGACGVTGGAPTGVAVGKDPATVCCLP